MGRWARENEFDPLVKAAVEWVAQVEGPWPITTDRAFALVKGIIAAESNFNPNAGLTESQLKDASVGLMQILLSTARGLGYNGDAKGLIGPGVNIPLGARYLRQLLSRAGSEDGAISAYNGSYRPSFGFGAKRTAATPVVCIRWKPGTPPRPYKRTVAKDCAEVGSTVPGTYSNQKYVDRVKDYTAYFFGTRPLPGPGS